MEAVSGHLEVGIDPVGKMPIKKVVFHSGSLASIPGPALDSHLSLM